LLNLDIGSDLNGVTWQAKIQINKWKPKAKFQSRSLSWANVSVKRFSS